MPQNRPVINKSWMLTDAYALYRNVLTLHHLITSGQKGLPFEYRTNPVATLSGIEDINFTDRISLLTARVHKPGLLF